MATRSQVTREELQALQRMLERANAPRQGAGRPRKRPIVLATDERPARVAPEPRWALAFFLRRMDGIGWDRAAAETAEGFGLAGERGGPEAVERAAKDWRPVVIPFLIDRFPEKADRLRQFLREPR
jgi:hypothetical protein